MIISNESSLNNASAISKFSIDLIELDLNILGKFLEVLKEIEDGKLDQHEGAYKVGLLLKDMYLDSAVKKADKLNEKYNKEEKPVNKKPKKISYAEFKLKNN